MKTTKTLKTIKTTMLKAAPAPALPLLCLLLLSLGLRAQDIEKKDRFDGPLYQGGLSNKDFFKKSDYIFKGKKIEHKPYLNSDTTRVMTSTVYEVTEVYKGGDRLRKGDRVELVRNCGVFFDGRPEELKVVLDDKNEHCFKAASRMILFCTASDTVLQKEKSTLSVKPLHSYRDAGLYQTEGMEHDLNFQIYGLNDLYFKDMEDFYDYARRYRGLTLPERQK